MRYNGAVVEANEEKKLSRNLPPMKAGMVDATAVTMAVVR